MLTDVSLYWLTATAASSARLAREHRAADRAVPGAGGRGCVRRTTSPSPCGRWPSGLYHIRHWSEFDRGGHFAAMEVPDLLADDIRDFFRELQESSRSGA